MELEMKPYITVKETFSWVITKLRMKRECVDLGQVFWVLGRGKSRCTKKRDVRGVIMKLMWLKTAVRRNTERQTRRDMQR